MARPRRRIYSYKSACKELAATRFEADSEPLPTAGAITTGAEWEGAVRIAQRSPASPEWIKAYPLASSPSHPYLIVAEFAGVLVLARDGHQLRDRTGQAPSFKNRANLQWVYWGELIAPPAGPLTLGSLSIGPWPGADSPLEPDAAPFQGLTSQVLRAISPDTIVHRVVDRLKTLEEWQQYLADKHGLKAPAEQRQLLKQALQRASRPPVRQGRKYPDSHYRDIAILYLDLLNHGHAHRILHELAQQLGIRRETARDWVHRARELGYLTGSHHGRAGALPGPRLPNNHTKDGD